MRMIAEVIASAFPSGLSWRGSLGGKEVYCPPPGLRGGQIMDAFDRFLEDNPDMADKATAGPKSNSFEGVAHAHDCNGRCRMADCGEGQRAFDLARETASAVSDWSVVDAGPIREYDLLRDA